MPWTPESFAEKHNHSLSGKSAAKAAAIANAMLRRGVPEGEAIATANARAEGLRTAMARSLMGHGAHKA